MLIKKIFYLLCIITDKHMVLQGRLWNINSKRQAGVNHSAGGQIAKHLFTMVKST